MADSSQPKKVQRKMNSSSSERKIVHFGCDRDHRPKESGRRRKAPKAEVESSGHSEPAHPPVHHPLDAHDDSVVDDLHLSYYLVSSW